MESEETTLGSDSMDKHLNFLQGAPVSVMCALTYDCNLHCIHCLLDCPKSDLVELTTQKWESLIDQLAEIGVFTITFTGGEPLLRDDLEQLISCANKRRLVTSMFTNGFALTRNRIRRLASSGLQEVKIDLDGSDVKTHDLIRGMRGVYARVTKAIPLMVKEGIHVQVVSTVLKMNVEQIPHIIELAYNLGAHSFFIQPFFSVGRGKRMGTFSPALEDYARLLPKIYEKERDLGIKISYPLLPASSSERSTVIRKLMELEKLSSCVSGVFDCSIQPGGEVTPCCVDLNIVAGNINERDFADIWRYSDIFVRLRHGKGLKECSGCELEQTVDSKELCHLGI